MNNSVLHHSKISIPEKNRIDLISMLNVSLASLSDLYAQLKNAHWNVKGLQFIALHKLFDEQAESLEEHVDIVAERITALGGTAHGTVQDVVANTKLKSFITNVFEAKLLVEHLAHNFAILGELARKNICDAEQHGDIATGDIYIGLVRFLDKNLWFLEAHLQK